MASPVNRRACAALAGAVALLGSLVALPARADVDVAVRIGHGGAWIEDAATPLVVTLASNGDAPVRADVEVRGSGMLDRGETIHRRSVVLAPGVTRRELFLVAGPRAILEVATVGVRATPPVPVRSRTKTGDKGRLDIDVRASGGGELSALGFAGHAIGVVNDPRSVFAARLPACERIGTLLQVEPEDRIRVVHVDAADACSGPLALDGIETLVVCDPGASFASSPRETENLLDWVALGGRLVVSLGSDAAQFAASPLAAELPARWTGADVADSVALAAAFGAPPQREWVPRAASMARLRADERAVQGVLRVAASLGAVRPFGDGWIVVIGCDLRPVLETIPAEAGAVVPILRALLHQPAPQRPSPIPGVIATTYDASSPIGRLLRGTAFSPPPGPFVLFGLVAYVLVVGPLDWFVLKNLRKERWTTLTFGGSVAIFTVVAYAISLLLFSASAATSRVTFVHLASGGREGREVARVRELAGHYAPVAELRTCRYPLPAAVLGAAFPGFAEAGGVGGKLPVVVEGNDPFAPTAQLDIAFRSQRVVATVMAGGVGRTLDARAAVAGDTITVELDNGLPCDVGDAWVFLPGGKCAALGGVGAGASRSAQARIVSCAETPFASAEAGPLEGAATPDARTFLTRLVASSSLPGDLPGGYHALRRAGIVGREPRPGRGLLVAFAEGDPFGLPGPTDDASRHVVLTREVVLR